MIGSSAAFIVNSTIKLYQPNCENIKEKINISIFDNTEKAALYIVELILK